MDVLFDLETLDLRPSAVVLSAAFIPFEFGGSRSFEDLVASANVIRFPIRPQVAAGRTICSDTLRWWTSPAIPAGLLNAQIDPTPNASMGHICARLSIVRRLFNSEPLENVRWWCRGPALDGAVLGSLCSDAGVDAPWRYDRLRDVRTVLEALAIPYPSPRPAGFVSHDPAHDAALDALALQSAAKYSHLPTARPF
ncbi:MAG TPA: 3'-5' exoribonuclease [Pseudomonadales bacterium]|nr:3'-5' exoribonuclease [Pseudomonadales bacterium]